MLSEYKGEIGFIGFAMMANLSNVNWIGEDLIKMASREVFAT